MTFLKQPLSDNEAPERIECVCSRTPLLARAGRMDGQPFLWIKNVRARFEVVMTSGVTHIKCRECNRWHRFTVTERVESEIE